VQAQEQVRLEEQRRLEAQRQEELRKQRERMKAAESKGEEGKAQKIQEQIQNTKQTVIQVEAKVTTPSTIIKRKRWTFRIINEKKIPRRFLIVDETALRKLATSLKEKAECPGVEFYSEDEIASKST